MSMLASMLACMLACMLTSMLASMLACILTQLPEILLKRHELSIKLIYASVDDLDVTAAVAVSSGFLLMVASEQLSKRKKRNVWVKPWILTHPVCGAYTTLFSDLVRTDAASFKNYTRLDLPAFDDLLSRVEGAICKQRTRFWPKISHRERLCLTPR